MIRLDFFSLGGDNLFFRIPREVFVGLLILKPFDFCLEHADKKNSIRIFILRYFVNVVYCLRSELLVGGKLFWLGVRGRQAGIYPAPAPSLIATLFFLFHFRPELLNFNPEPLDGRR